MMLKYEIRDVTNEDVNVDILGCSFVLVLIDGWEIPISVFTTENRKIHCSLCGDKILNGLVIKARYYPMMLCGMTKYKILVSDWEKIPTDDMGEEYFCSVKCLVINSYAKLGTIYRRLRKWRLPSVKRKKRKEIIKLIIKTERALKEGNPSLLRLLKKESEQLAMQPDL